METKSNPTQRSWLLLGRGILYVAIGIVMFVFASTYAATSGVVIGCLALSAGIFQLVFSFSNERDDKNNVWGILHGVADVGFGIAMFVYAGGTLTGFVDVLGFWAIMYAFLQSVQAMYTFMAARGAGVVSNTSFVHFGNVLTAGGLAFTLLFRPAGPATSLGFVGIFPIVLGVLIIVMTRQMQAQRQKALNAQ